MALMPPVTTSRERTLRDLRERACLTQGELAAMADVSRYSVVRLEAGLYCTPRIRRQLAQALGVEPSRVQWPQRIAPRPTSGD